MPAFVGTEVARTRSRVAVAARERNPEKLTEAKRDHAAAMLARHIERIVSQAPPLTAEQRDRLAVLLRGEDA